MLTFWSNRFWSKVNKRGPVHPILKTRCWLWKAALRLNYGRFNIGGKLVSAHHAAWYLTHGVWPSDKLLHRCDNPTCIRPGHLLEGSQADNTRDMAEKGRGIGNPQRGETHGNNKLKNADVMEIRRLYGKGNTTQRELAAQYGVCQMTISKVVRALSWDHI